MSNFTPNPEEPPLSRDELLARLEDVNSDLAKLDAGEVTIRFHPDGRMEAIVPGGPMFPDGSFDSSECWNKAADDYRQELLSEREWIEHAMAEFDVMKQDEPGR